MVLFYYDNEIGKTGKEDKMGTLISHKYNVYTLFRFRIPIQTQVRCIISDWLRGYFLFTILCVAILGFGTQRAFADVIIDNGGSGTSYTGTWSASSGTKPYGANSVWARNSATYTWQMLGQPAGAYEVLMWWTPYSSRSANAAVEISHRDGTTDLSINQQQNGSRWNSLGTYYFDSTGSVKIIASSGSTVTTCADAVWFKPISEGEVRIDNSDARTSRTGTWQVSSATNWYGTDSVWSRNGATFTWNFAPPQGGDYEVSMWWTPYSSRSANIPVDITDSSGTSRVYINQRQNGGRWNSLGTYHFTSAGSVKITAASGSTITTCADAVKFNFIEFNNAPIAVIDAIGPDPARAGETVYFDGHGEDSDGNIAAYSWESDIDGSLSSEASFAAADLSEGEHIITFKVQDNKGKWSAPVTEPLVVGNVPPVAFIDSISPNPALTGQTVTLTGHGEDSDGTIEAYQWHSSIDGNLSDEASFTTNLLSIGAHTITFTVYDNNGVASVPVNRTLAVQNLVSDTIIDNGGSGTSSTGT
jgi:hypothetical protein